MFLGRKPVTSLDSVLKTRGIYFANKGPYSQRYGFSSSQVWMWELDYKEGCMPKNWCFSTVVLEKTLENPLDFEEIQPVCPKGNQFWIFIGRTDAKAEVPIIGSPATKNWLIGKDPDAGKDWRQEKEKMTEDEMVSWHHWLNRHESEQVPGIGNGQGSLACCMHSWGRKELDTTEWLNWNFLPQKAPGFYFDRSKTLLDMLWCYGLPQNHILFWMC